MTQIITSGPAKRSRASLTVIVAGLVVGVAVLVVALVLRQWDVAILSAVALLSLSLASKTRPAVLSFEVGQAEKHQVGFRFDQFWGSLVITVDGQIVKHDLRLFSVRLTKAYMITVGTAEVHTVRIEKTRPLWLAGTRSQQVRAYVDDVLTAETSTMAHA